MIRDANTGDLDAVEQIHAQMGSDFAFPFPKKDGKRDESPLFLVRKVATDENGNVRAACMLRIEAETYLFLDPSLSAREKVDLMLELQPEVLRNAWALGLENVVAWIPEQVERRFQRRLKQLGWTRDRTGWHSWCRHLSEADR